MKRVLISVALLFASVLIFPSPASAQSNHRPHHGPTLEVATYNIHAGAGLDEVFDLDRTAAQIAELDADVVALQEVDVHWDARSQWRDLATELADKLGMAVFFGPIYSVDPPQSGDPQREYGNALLSKYPIESSENHEITRLSSQDPDPVPAPAPGFPEIVIRVHGVPVHVYSTHLDVSPEPDVRATQVHEMLAIMAKNAAHPQVLMGDFNTGPESNELSPLWRYMNDAWLDAGNDSDTGASYPADAPNKRIDFIASSPWVKAEQTSVIASVASDHRPVVSQLKLLPWLWKWTARASNGLLRSKKAS